jgi:hypothetical protein
MFTKVLPLTAIVLVISVCQLQAEVINSTWVGGSKGSWGEADNWSPAIVPDNSEWRTFAVTISGNDVDIDLGVSRVIDQLDCYGNINFGRGWPMEWVSLNLAGPNGLKNHGYLSTDSQVTLHIVGNLDNPEGCTIDTAINGGFDVDGNVENAGRIMSCPPFGLGYGQLHNVGQIIVFGGVCAGKFLYDDSTGTIMGFGAFVVTSPFINKGNIYATGGELTVATYDLLSNTGTIGNTTLTSLNVMHIGSLMNVGVPSDMNNFGAIEVNAGGGVAFDCNLVNEPNGVIKLLNGTLAAKTITQKAGATFEGFGGITGNVVIDPNATIKLTGPTNITGDLTIEEGAMLDITDGTVLVTGLTTCNGGTIRTYHGTIIMQGGESGDICRRIFVD